MGCSQFLQNVLQSQARTATQVKNVKHNHCKQTWEAVQTESTRANLSAPPCPMSESDLHCTQSLIIAVVTISVSKCGLGVRTT